MRKLFTPEPEYGIVYVLAGEDVGRTGNEMNRLINLTPHAVTIFGTDGVPVISLPPSGQVARVSVTRERVGDIGLGDGLGGVPAYRSTYGEVTGLPDASPTAGEDTPWLLVSALVRLALPGRRDLVSPGELVRDGAGQPIGCLGLEVQP